MWAEKIVFTIFYCIIIFGVYNAVVVGNPVYSVLYLIVGFFGIAGLLIYLSVDYLAVLFILVYGGAISILIMFVVMMLDLKELELRNTPPLLIFKFFLLFFTIISVCYLASLPNETYHIPIYTHYVDWDEVFNRKTNIEVVGIALFNHFTLQFLLVGFILFVAMVIIISLVLRRQGKARRQILYKQLAASNLKMLMTK